MFGFALSGLAIADAVIVFGDACAAAERVIEPLAADVC